MGHRHLLVCVGLSIGGVLVLGPPAQAMQPVDSTPCSHRLISAHEGYRRYADGDTVASQQAAFGVGSNLADTDLWVTTDGYIVEMHDNDVSHSTNGTGLITNKTLAQVRQLRTTRYHEPIPRMVQSLNIPAAHGHGRYLQMETKWSFNERGAMTDLNNRIVAAGMTYHVVIYSAYLSQLQRLESIDPHLTTWYKAGSPPPIRDLTGLNGVMLKASQLTKPRVSRYQRAGYSVIRGLVDPETSASWKHFVYTGARGLMSDQPPGVIAECRAL
ncbi:MAG: hypothetical protein QOI51_2413 [Nocardioidaceae bacterium]|jgi:glycerophosphoryl diester phosphodiesterase|nr:hypothetical protein [Nocardioidaceae bacterium]MDX6309985.1 hypothetical protein [Nocardioidaceae bacterium]